ncbi:hypothetical protein GCM10027168_66470 [Streptomyces capparidis]
MAVLLACALLAGGIWWWASDDDPGTTTARPGASTSSGASTSPPASGSSAPGPSSAPARLPAPPAAPAGWRAWHASIAPDGDGAGSRDGDCLVAGGSLYCANSDYRAIRVDVATGKVRWRAEHGAAAYHRTGVVGVHGDTVVTRTGTHSLAGLDRDTGRARWVQEVTASGVVAHVEGTVFITSQSLRTGVTTLWALDPADGSVRWQRDVGTRRNTELVAAGDVVMYVSPPAGNEKDTWVHGYRVRDGGRLWELEFPQSLHPVAIEGGGAYFTERGTGGEGGVARLDLGTKKLTRVALPTAPVHGEVADGVVYVADSGTLYAVDPRRGTRRTAPLPGVEGSPPLTVVAGRVLMTEGGELLAFDARDGRRLWSAAPPPGSGPTTEPHPLQASRVPPLPAGGVVLAVTPTHVVYSVSVADRDRSG